MAGTGHGARPGGHDADGACAGDQHILATRSKLKRGVDRIAKRVEDGTDYHRKLYQAAAPR